MFFYDTDSRGMSSTAGFVKPQWHSTAHFPHTETAGKKTLKPLNAGKPWRKSKQAFSCCLGKKEKTKTKQNHHNTFHAKLRGFSPPSGHRKYFILHQKHHLRKILFSCR